MSKRSHESMVAAATTTPLLTFDGWLDLPREMRNHVIEQLRAGARARDVASARGLASLYVTSRQMRLEVGVGGLDYAERQNEEALLCYALLESDLELLRALAVDVYSMALFVRGTAVGRTHSLDAVLANAELRRALMSDTMSNVSMFNHDIILIAGCFCGMVRAGYLIEAAAFIHARASLFGSLMQPEGNITNMIRAMAETPGAVDALFPLFPFLADLRQVLDYSVMDLLIRVVGETGSAALLSWILEVTQPFVVFGSRTGIAGLYKVVAHVQAPTAGACFDVLMADARFNRPTAAILQNALASAIGVGSVPALEWLVTRGGAVLPDRVALNEPAVRSVAFIDWLEAHGVAVDVSAIIAAQRTRSKISPVMADWLLRRGHRDWPSADYFAKLIGRYSSDTPNNVDALLDIFLRHHVTIPRHLFHVKLLIFMAEYNEDSLEPIPIDVRWAARQGYFRDYDGGILAAALGNPGIDPKFLVWAHTKAGCAWPPVNETWRRFICAAAVKDYRTDVYIDAVIRYLLLDEHLPVGPDVWTLLVDVNATYVARLFFKYGAAPTPAQRTQLRDRARANGQEKMEALLDPSSSSFSSSSDDDAD